MNLETKYLRLRVPVELGSWFGDWQVCWLGGWSKHKLDYLVMLVKGPVSKVPFAGKDPGPAAIPERKKCRVAEQTPPGPRAQRRLG